MPPGSSVYVSMSRLRVAPERVEELVWAVQDADGLGVDFGAQVQWLGSVPDARGYPLASLADALETLAGEAEDVAAGASGRLREGVVLVRP